jgi:tRNA pseudouridine38-40 synthase
MRYRAILAYDGTAYQGFQQQTSTARTVLGAVEAALATVSGASIRVIGAGRTDAGVHATGQVIAFDLDTWRHGDEQLQRALNATLPTDLALLTLAPTTPDFHPRFDARSRTYRYLVAAGQVRHPLLARTHWHLRLPTQKATRLEVDRMNAAAAQLTGVHDFASFGNPPEPDRSSVTIREVFRSEWRRVTGDGALGQEGGAVDTSLFAYTIEANAFLYHMVRAIVAALVEVGLNRMTFEQFSDGFQAKDRRRFGNLAPAHGLTLTAVKYDESGTTPAKELEHDD